MDLTYMTCAYDKNHEVNPLKFNTHQTKCRERYLEQCEKDGVAVEIFICKWDSTHHIHISALEHHEENCVEKRLVPINISAPWGAKTKENSEDDGEDVIIPVRGGPDIPRAYDPGNKDKWRVNTIGFNTKPELWNRCPGSKNPQKCKTDKPQQCPQSGTGYSGSVPNLSDGNTTSSTKNAKMEMDRRMVCAYDKRHLVSPTDFIAHQDKCRDRYVEQQKRYGQRVEIVICKWCSSHHVHISVLEKHEDICSAKPVVPTDSDARLSAHIQDEKKRCENAEEQFPVARGRGTRIEYRAVPRKDYRGVPVLTHQPEANPTLEQGEVAQVETGTNDTIQELEAPEAEIVQQLGDLSLPSISVQRTFPYIHQLSETLRNVDRVPTLPSYPYSTPVEPELEPDITSEEQAKQTKEKTEEDETAYARESLALLKRTAKWAQENKEPSRPFEDRGSTVSLSSRLYCPSDVSFGEGYDEW